MSSAKKRKNFDVVNCIVWQPRGYVRIDALRINLLKVGAINGRIASYCLAFCL